MVEVDRNYITNLESREITLKARIADLEGQLRAAMYYLEDYLCPACDNSGWLPQNHPEDAPEGCHNCYGLFQLRKVTEHLNKKGKSDG